MYRTQGRKVESLAILLSPGRREETRRMLEKFNDACKKQRKGNGGEKECAIEINSTVCTYSLDHKENVSTQFRELQN